MADTYDLIRKGATARNTKDLAELEPLPGCAGIKVFMGPPPAEAVAFWKKPFYPAGVDALLERHFGLPTPVS